MWRHFIRCFTDWKNGAGSAVAGWKRQGNVGAGTIGLQGAAGRFSPRNAMAGETLWKRSVASRESNMPDFKSEIRRSLTGLSLSPTREDEIVEELAQDLEERFEQALSHGASEEEAKQTALDELTDPDSLVNQLKRVERPVRHGALAIGARTKGNRFAGFWDDLRFGLRM